MPAVKILIVEDESIVAMDIADKLERLGYEVIDMVDSGELALQAVTENQPDLVLMDIVLQGDIDGVQTAEEIKSQFQIPVIYLTAYADKKTLERAKITEPFGYILKPFKEAELNATIQMALSRIEAEKKLRKNLQISEELKKQAEALSELRSRYISMTSHEFRTPMSVIQMSANLLERYSDKWSEEKKINHIHRIQSAINNMNQLLEDVLTLGKAESGTVEFNPSPTDLVNFCQEIIEELQLITHNQIPINLSSNKNETEVYLDRKLLRHIVTNLLSNALKYSPDGGTVNLKIHIEDKQISLEFKDEGIGIPPEDQQKLFEAFHRSVNVGKIPGTGLGLAIVKQCVDLHQGKITVKSEVAGNPQQGTTFTVTLPINTPSH